MRQTLLSYLDDCLKRADETAVVCGHGLRISRWSYGELGETAFRFARELESRNIVKGDRVLLWAENSAEWIAAFFGCLLRGVIAVPIDKHSAPDFVPRVQQQVAAKLLLHSRDIKPNPKLNLTDLALDELVESIAHHSSTPYAIDKMESPHRYR